MIGRVALVAGAALLAVPAAAQNGAMWTDDKGRMMSLSFGAPTPQPAPAARDAAAMATLFKQVCVDGWAAPEAVGAAAAAQGLSSEPQTLPFGKTPLTLDIWRGEGVAVSRADAFLGNKARQCNATFYVPALPAATDVAQATSAALGAEPANAAKAVNKKGEPNKGYQPEWTLTAPDGGTWIATAFVAKDSQYMPGNRVQLALRAAGKGK